MVTHLDPLDDLDSSDPSALPFPSTTEDPGFTSVQVFRYNEQAQYPDGSEQPARTGEEAMDVYAASIQEAQASVGIQQTARFNVEGVFIGDGQEWDEVWIDFVPSTAAYEAYSSAPAVADAQLHFDAAVEGSYDIVVEDTLISRIPTGTEMTEETPDDDPDNGGGNVGTADRTTQLSQHDGYWVGEVDIPGVPISATVINDAYYDADTDRMTVYAQTRVLGSRVVAPPQVGPGECTQLPTGGDACFHPNAVYLNGSGEELMEADGTGQWWVKHSWIVDGEGYENVELGAAAEYESMFVEGELQDDGSIKIGGLDPMAPNYFFNVRNPDLTTDPPTFTVTTFEPTNNDPSAGEIDLTAVEQGTLTLQCTMGSSALDGSVRGCPTVQEEPDNNVDIEDVNVGYEILQIVSPSEIVVWLNTSITQEEFDAIDLPQGWFKNQPREGVVDAGSFAGSPGSTTGQFVEAVHFGHEWRHVATVVESNVPLDDAELLTVNTIAKSHELAFDAESTLSILISPDDEHYVLVTRDAGRTSDTPTMPDGWQVVEYTLEDELVLQLPNPTLNIRADNEDSFQGPVPELAELLAGEQTGTPGDLDNDGDVGFTDFLILADTFGSTVQPAGTGADLDEDGVVGFGDFLILSRNFGNIGGDDGTHETANLLALHDGYWVGDIPGAPAGAQMINDMYVDTETGEATVYAQARIGDNVVAPVQVGPGECTQLPNGTTGCFHPNAVYLNGSGEELMEADGTGQWWVKHPVLADEGYFNVEVGVAEEYDGVFAEGELLDDGSIRIGGSDPVTGGYGFNVREVDVNQEIPTYTLTRYRPANLDPSAGEIDLTPVTEPNQTFRMQCTTAVSALDGSERGCPTAPEEPHGSGDNNDDVTGGDDHSNDEDRYCELLAVTLEDGTPTAEVWWTNSTTDCTANVWNVDLDQAQEDLGAFQVIKNGPRYFVVDDNERLAGGGVPPTQEVAGIQMLRVASVTADPSQATDRTPYQPAVVDRNNVFTYDAGSEVYELTSPDGDVYIMQSYAQIVDPTLTSDDLPGLESRLELPEGWTYSSRVLEEAIVLTASEPIEVLQDELQNSYSKLRDGDDNDPGETDGEHLTDCFDDPVIMTAADGTEFVRTPDSCFADLPDWPYEPQYVEIDGLRQAYVDEGPEDGPVVLLLHGQPSWSYLYRDMIPVLADAGYRVIAMDHLGMGRSDKPIDIERYSYLDHNHRLEQFIAELELTDINLFGQDWGSLIGLRTAGLNTDLFATISIGNGSLPTFPEGENVQPPVENPDEIVDIPALYAAIPDQQVAFYDGCERLPLPTAGANAGGANAGGEFGQDFDAFGYWMRYAMTGASFQPSGTLEALTWFDLTPEEEAAYDAPFPSRTYMAGPRVFPSLINDVPGTTEDAWEGLSSFEKPFLTIWASNDPGFQGSCEAQQFLINSVPGAEGQPHTRIPEASHFLQDDQGEEIATQLVAFYEANGIEGVETIGTDAEILSANLGVIDIPFPQPLTNITGVEQQVGDEGMPMVFSVPIDATTLSAEDFAITTASGAITKPIASPPWNRPRNPTSQPRYYWPARSDQPTTCL